MGAERESVSIYTLQKRIFGSNNDSNSIFEPIFKLDEYRQIYPSIARYSPCSTCTSRTAVLTHRMFSPKPF